MNSKLIELEGTAKQIFGENFVGLAETCAVFGKDLNENDSASFYSFSTNSEDLLRKDAREGNSLIIVPKGMTGEVICSKMPKGFIIKLTPLEIASLMRKVLTPGCYLVKNQPICTWGTIKIGGPKNPALEEILFVYTLRNLLKRKMQLVEQICVLCKDEVIRRGEKMPVCFKIDKTVGEIKAWESHMPLLSFLPIRKYV